MSYQAYPNVGFLNLNLNPHAPRPTSHLQQHQQQQQPHPAATQNPSAQASLQSSLTALNGKIVQAQSLALLNGITVDEVLARMGGLTEMELGLLRLCAAREQEARLSASLVSQQQQMAMLQQQQQQQQQSKRNSNRLSFPGLPSAKSTATNASGNGWEEGFANLSLGNGEVRTPTPNSGSLNSMSYGGRVSPPVTTASSTSAISSRAESGRGEKRSSVILPGSGANSVGTNGTGKHEQAASWRSASASGKMPQTGGVVSPHQTGPRSVISSSGSNEPASKGFNSLFGNKIVPRQTSRASSAGSSPVNGKSHQGEDGGEKTGRNGRSGSASSSSASSDAARSNAQDAQSQQQQRQDHLESLLAGANRAREMTFSGSSSSFESVVTPPPVLITPPCDQYAGRQNSGSVGYFGIKKVIGGTGDVQVHGQPQQMNANANVRNGLGVIGQGFGANQAVHQRMGTASYGVVVRQPHGPPGGADELGNKNFASRLRQKAVSDLGLLGKRRANSPNPNGYAIAA